MHHVKDNKSGYDKVFSAIVTAPFISCYKGDFQMEEIGIHLHYKSSNNFFDQIHILFPTMQKEGWEGEKHSVQDGR